MIRNSDGRLAPFEPDRLSRTLFAATDANGRPDAFLARELADQIARSLADEIDGPLAAEELDEQVTKYVREFGHPALALSYRQAAADINPAEVFPRDVISLANDGLLLLAGIDQPSAMAGLVLGHGLDPTQPGLGLSAAIAQAALLAGGWLVIDSPDRALAALPGDPDELAGAFHEELQTAATAAERRIIVNLNIATPPAWASDPGTGPLFAGLGSAPNTDRLVRCTIALLARLWPSTDRSPIGIAWHMTPQSLNAEPWAVVADMVAFTSQFRVPIEFVIDRARQPIALGGGVTRQSPAVLLTVGVHLARLAEQVAPASEERFLAKLGSLARLARSAGHAKLDFLRRQGHPELHNAFLLDRARLIVVPVGLDEAVRQLGGAPLCDGARGTALARRIVEQMQQALASAPPHNMPATLDGLPLGFGFEAELPSRREAAGLTPWDADAPPRLQLRCAGSLHAAARAGTAAILVPTSAEILVPPNAAISDLLGTLRLAAHYDVQRLRFVGAGESSAGAAL